MRFLLFISLFSLLFSYTNTSDVLTKFNITIQAPGNRSSPSQIPYKSIHVKYTLPSNDDRWNIVGFEPFIQVPNEGVQQMTVHLCDTTIHANKHDFIWFDNEANLNDDQSMLIYEWTSDLSLSPLRLADNLGFSLNKSNSIILTITYTKEHPMHQDRSGIILHISTQVSRFHMGTIAVGNREKNKRFSCRSTNFPRLLYGIKALFSNKNSAWWHIYVIRNRSFGRKSVQYVLDSSKILDQNKTDIEMVEPDIFLLSGDYIIIECERISQPNCNFLIFYTYKKLQYKSDHMCQNDNYPSLFKLIPSRKILEENKILTTVSSINGTIIFLLVCILLFVIWILTIVVCVVMRRIRGLVNFRSEPSTPASFQKTRTVLRGGREQSHQRTANEGDRVAQMDVEHMGLMS